MCVLLGCKYYVCVTRVFVLLCATRVYVFCVCYSGVSTLCVLLGCMYSVCVTRVYVFCSKQLMMFLHDPFSNAPLCLQSCFCSGAVCFVDVRILHRTVFPSILPATRHSVFSHAAHCSPFKNFQSCLFPGPVCHVNARILYRTDCHFLPITLPAMHHSVFSHAAHCTPFVFLFRCCVT